jgi:hypothetical protein
MTTHTIQQNSGESVFESYQSVLSYIMGDANVYQLLAKMVGADKYVSHPDAEQEIVDTEPNENIIFNDSSGETHYKFYYAKTKKIYDPYNLFQIPHSHGNCLFYVLYICSKFLNPDHHRSLFPEELIRTSKFLTHTTYKKEKYVKVGKDKQLAYKCFVYNDFIIIKNMIRLLNENPELQKAFKKAWSTLTSSEKKDYDIPKTKFTSDQFIKELNEVFDNKIENTWKMTWDVVEIWDANKSHTIPPNNTGIEDATEGEVNKLKYKLTSNDLNAVTFF